MIKQQEMLNHFLPILETKGVLYRKKTLIKARKANPGTLVVTKTNDGDETKNTAKSGDWLVENQTSSSEQYLVAATVFDTKYEMIQSLGNGWSSFQPKGKVTAIPITKMDFEAFENQDTIHFEAPWKELTVLRIGDFLVTPPEKDEIYRIAKKEFGETYEKC